MSVIRIEIDMNSIEDMIPGFGDGDDDNFVCPVSTQDADLNDKNRQVAVDERHYGAPSAEKTEKEMRCGTCANFNLRSALLNCISEGLGLKEGSGYCDELHFVASMENVCDLWSAGSPTTDGDLDDYPSDFGNQRDVM